MRAWNSNDIWLATSNNVIKNAEILVVVYKCAPIRLEELSTNTRETLVRRAYVPF
jgi:hypothetical protein